MFNNFWCWNYHFFPLVVPLIQSSTFILNSRGLNILFNRQNEVGNITWSSHVICVTCTLRKSLDRSVLESFTKAEKLTSVKPRWILRWKNSNLHKSISTSTFTSKFLKFHISKLKLVIFERFYTKIYSKITIFVWNVNKTLFLLLKMNFWTDFYEW